MGKEDGAHEKIKVEDLEYLGQQIRMEGQRNAASISRFPIFHHPHCFQNYLTLWESHPTDTYCVLITWKHT